MEYELWKMAGFDAESKIAPRVRPSITPVNSRFWGANDNSALAGCAGWSPPLPCWSWDSPESD